MEEVTEAKNSHYSYSVTGQCKKKQMLQYVCHFPQVVYSEKGSAQRVGWEAHVGSEKSQHAGWEKVHVGTKKRELVGTERLREHRGSV